MNSLGTTMLWSAVQVTLVMACGLIVHRVSARRGGPVAGAFVAALTLALVVASTVAALAPHPRWWTWRSLAGSAPVTRAAGEAAAPRPTVAVGRESGHQPAGASPTLLRSLARWFDPAVSGVEFRTRRWPDSVAVVALAGSGLGLLHLLLGMWAVHDYRRRSRPIDDPALIGLADSLREHLGYRRPVELREAPDLACAATIGWLRPVVLLPRDWPGWSEVETRAVLGHELAHVAGWHYLAGVVARLGVALHFYHPLAHRLAGWLRLEHELAADAAGAQLAGGRAAYVRVLSRMALTQDERPAHWPASTFLPGRGTLIRRIEMLKDRDRSMGSAARRSLSRFATAVPLVAVAVAVSTLNGAEPPRDASVNKATAATAGNRATRKDAFDLSYIPSDSQGLLIVRPAAAFRLPGMARNVETLMGLLSKAFPESRLPLEGIEQISTAIYVRDVKPPPGKDYSKQLMMSGFAARSVDDFDWKGEVERLARRLSKGWKLEERTHAGSVYYRLTGVPVLGPEGFFYLPDSRTVVCYPEPVIRRLIEEKPAARPEILDENAWSQVEGSVFACVIDNRKAPFTPTKPPTDVEDAAAYTLITKADRVTFGVAANGDREFCAIVSSQSQHAGSAIAQAGETIRSLLAKRLDHQLETPSKKAGHPFEAIRFLQSLCKHVRVEETPTSVVFRSETDVTLADVLAMVLRDGIF